MIRLCPEGVPGSDHTAYEPGALQLSQRPVPLRVDGEVVGMCSGFRVAEVDGQSWVAADKVVLNDDTKVLGGVRAVVDVVSERFDVAGSDGVRWVEDGIIRAVEVTAEPPFEGAGVADGWVGDTADLIAEADALLAAAVTEVTEIVEPVAALRWEGVLAIEGEPTGDGRLMDRGAIYWEDSQAPWPLKFDRDEGDHSAAIVGEITRIWRDGDNIMGEGLLHTNTTDPETAAIVARTVELLESANGAVPGVSVELDSENVDVRVDQAAWDEWQRELGDILDDEVPEPEDPEVVDGRVTVEKFRFDDWMYATTEARLRGAAIVDNPAFAEARIAIVASGGEVPRLWLTGETVVAHAAAATVDYDLPPREWFELSEPDASDPRVVWVDADGAPTDPNTEGARPWGIPLTVTDDGQVYGHLASWQDCHTAFTDRCLTPPRSNSDYSWFHTGSTKTAGGDVPTGRITVDTDHAHRHASAASAMGHYDQTGHAVADVRTVNGELGPWMSGWVRPWATAQQRHELAANPPSGDWRPRGNSTELIGVLCVNVPGFPLPRSVATYRAGEFASLVASGFASASPPQAPTTPDVGPLAARLAQLEARLDADELLEKVAK